jgi:uncharacterized tellurite resistance protein B-like protein
MFFKKDQHSNLIKVAALLIHVAKIDENYSTEEQAIIKRTLEQINPEIVDIDRIINEANEIEANSNQILNFTKEVKTMDNKEKILIIETLWRIIYSDHKADIYETSLMRRLAGLLYIDNKIMGDIKEKIKKENS